MAVTITPITLASLTEATLSGSGVFDTLMRAVKAHLDEEFKSNRIKGSDYATVYLGSLTQVLQQSNLFLMEKDKNALQAELIKAQIDLAKQQALNAVIEGQNLVLQGELLAAQKQNLDVERALTIAKTAQTEQQTINLAAEELNIPKQGLILDAQKAQIEQQTNNLVAEELNIPKQGLILDAQKAQIEQQTLNAITENATMLIQQNLLTAQVLLAQSQKISTDAQSALVIQKTVTEKAQTQAAGVDVDSVVGKQKCLYQAQTDGFLRDAEQRAAKLMVDTWNVRRTTDEATVADGVNKLSDATIGAAITKLLAGVGVVA